MSYPEDLEPTADSEVPVARWWRDPRLPVVVLAAGAAIYAIVFASLLIGHHQRFGTYAFDHGIFDQSIWLMGEGEGFNTVRGLHTWGHHASVGYYLFVPFYWLGAGPLFLDLAQLAILIAGGVAVFLLGRDLLRSDWAALVPAFAFLIHPSNQWFLREGFHPEVVAITPMLFAVLAAVRQRWWQYGLLVAVAVSFKEDMALAAAMLGIVVAVRGHRRIGIVTAVAALGWLFFVSTILIPAYSPEGDFYGEQFYGDFGDTPTEVAWSVITRPGDTYDRLDRADFLGYLRKIGGPLALLALLSPLPLLIAAPQIMINLLSVQGFTWSYWYHYAAIPVLAFTVASVEGLARLRRPRLRQAAVGAMGVTAAITAVVMGLSPVSRYYDGGYWALYNPRQELMEHAVSLPDPDDSVAASYNLLPHLSHRRHIYLFPNPWQALNWGVSGENPHDPATIEWLVLDRYTLDATQSAVVRYILSDGSWTVHLDVDGVLAAERKP